MFGLVRLAIRFFRRFSESRLPMNEDPTGHTSEQIKRGMESYWKKTACEQSEFLLGDLEGEEARAFAEQLVESIEVLSVESHDGDHATALVRTPTEDSDTPSEVTLVQCVFRNGLWEFSASAEVQSPSDPDALAVIGEPVTLQPGWKEPPFTITVRDSPETVDETTVRVPVRITGIIPRWAYDDVGSIMAFLQTAATDDGGPVQWVTEWGDSTHPLREGSFKGVILALGGTHEGFLYFKADDESPRRTVPEQPFVTLEYLDGTEALIKVDLARRATPVERIAFRDGVPLDNAYDQRIMEKLKESDSQWAEAAVPPAAMIGDTLDVTPDPDIAWLEMVVLAPPEPVDGNSVRLRVRIAAQVRGEERYDYFPLQISTGPDINGRVHRLWEFAAIGREAPKFPDPFMA